MAYVRRRTLEDGSKRYETCWRDPVTNKERSKTFTRRADADHFATLVEGDLARGVKVPRPADGRRTVAAVVERWLEVHGPRLKPKTAHSYRNLIDSRINPTLGLVPVGKLRYSDIQGWISAMLAEALSVSRIRQAHVVLASALDMAARDGLIAANPARGVVLPAPAKQERPWLEPAGDRSDRRRRSPPYGLAVRVMGYEGLRWGELAALKRRHVDPLNRRLHVVENVVEVGGRLTFGTPKSGRGRVVPIIGHLLAPLQRHLAADVDADPDSLLFLGPRGGVLRYSWWRRTVWEPACARTGIQKVTIHALRHSAGKALANCGVPPVVIKNFMGHASAAFTIDVYGHTGSADLDDAATALERYRALSLTATTRVSPLVARDSRGIDNDDGLTADSA